MKNYRTTLAHHVSQSRNLSPFFEPGTGDSRAPLPKPSGPGEHIRSPR